jgi:hypothetical protein
LKTKPDYSIFIFNLLKEKMQDETLVFQQPKAEQTLTPVPGLGILI